MSENTLFNGLVKVLKHTVCKDVDGPFHKYEGIVDMQRLLGWSLQSLNVLLVVVFQSYSLQ